MLIIPGLQPLAKLGRPVVAVYCDGRLTLAAAVRTGSLPFTKLLRRLFPLSNKTMATSCRPGSPWTSTTHSTAAFFSLTAARTLVTSCDQLEGVQWLSSW